MDTNNGTTSTNKAEIEAKLSQKRLVLTQTEDEIKRLEEDLRVAYEKEMNEKKRKYEEFMIEPEDDAAPNHGTYLPEKLDNLIHNMEWSISLIELDLDCYRKQSTDIHNLLATAARTPLPFHRFTCEEIKAFSQLDSWIEYDEKLVTVLFAEWSGEHNCELPSNGIFQSMIHKADQDRPQSPP